MSDAREKRMIEFANTHRGDPAVQAAAFNAGWDAAKADLPDRDEWIALFEDQGRWATSADRADAVMSLLRGETNNG